MLEEVTSKKKKVAVVSKKYEGQQTKKGTSKIPASAAAQQTMTFTLEEPSGPAAEGKRKRTRKSTATVISRRATMHVDPHADA